MSGSDVSGDGSQLSGSSFDTLGKLQPGQDDADSFDESQALQTGLFGVLYTVSKEKDEVPMSLVVFRLLFDVLQLWLLMVNPQYGYNINKDNLIWKIVSFVQLNDFMQSRGYTFFLGALYIFIILLAADVGLCAWVGQAFRSNRFDMVWPIVCLRYFSLVFFQVLDIASMTLFLMALDCRYFSVDNELQFINQEFDVECFSGSHMLHASVAAVALVIFTTLAVAFTMGEMELNLLTQNYLAYGHSQVEVQGFLMKFVMTCASVFIVSIKWYSVVQVVFATWMVYLYIKWEPQYYAIVNNFRVGSYTLVWYCSVLLVLMAFQPGVDQSDDDAVGNYKNNITIAMWAGMGPMFCVGCLASHLRLQYLGKVVIQRFKNAPPNAKTVKLYRFTDPREVELLARCCRKWVDVDELDPEAVALGEVVVRAGLQQLPKSCYMVILQSSFLIDVQMSYQSGYAQLQAAKKLDPSFMERFAIYSREQQHTQKAAGANPGTATDLVSYVEFQRNYRVALKVHREALLSIRGFWESLVHHNVKFEQLARAVIKIDTSVRAAEKTYRMVLQRHSTNVKLVRLYAKFLESCKEDPWGAAKWFTEADRLQQQDEESKNNNMLDGFMLGENGLPAVEEGHGVIICNAQGVMQMTNVAMCEMLGYSKNELKGRNISTIMPSPLKENHNKLMRNYIIASGGVEIKMNRSTEQIVVHKDGYVIPVRVTVMRISGIGEDSMFLGLVVPLPRAPNTANVWLLAATGLVLSVDEFFMDWTGFRMEETSNVPVSSFILPHAGLTAALAEARTAATGVSNSTFTAVMDDPKPSWGSAQKAARQGVQALAAEHVRSAVALVTAKTMARGGISTYGAAGAVSGGAGAIAEGVEPEAADAAAAAAADGAAPAATSAAAAAVVRAVAGLGCTDADADASGDVVSFAAAVDDCDARSAAGAVGESLEGGSTGSRHRHASSSGLAFEAFSGGSVSQIASRLRTGSSTSTKQRSSHGLLAAWAGFGASAANQAPAPAAAPPAPILTLVAPMSKPAPTSTTSTDAILGNPSDPGALPVGWACVRGVRIMHKYASTIDTNISITNGGSGAYAYHVLHITRCAKPLRSDPAADLAVARTSAPVSPSLSLTLARTPRSAIPKELVYRPGTHMVVCDRKGRMLHVTQSLASRLGTSTKALGANGSVNAMDGLLPQPFAQLHRQLIASGPPLTAPPAHSCRTGLAVPLVAKGLYGCELVPFRVSSLKREMPGTNDVVHVIGLEEVGMEKALNERRLLLQLDGHGVITVARPSPRALFGVEPKEMPGRHVSEYLDVFRPPDDAELPEEEKRDWAMRLLTELVRRALEAPGRSYRVGVSPPAKPQESADLGAIGAALPASRACPAIMTVSLVTKEASPAAGEDGQRGASGSADAAAAGGSEIWRASEAGAPAGAAARGAAGEQQQQARVFTNNTANLDVSRASLCVEIELWRTDLVTSVIEVDLSGCVLQSQPMALYPPGLVFGVPHTAMWGQHIHHYIPLEDQSLSTLLNHSRHDHQAVAEAAARLLARRSSMRQHDRQHDTDHSRHVGPVTKFKTRHSSDGMELEIAVQVARRNGAGGYYIVVHPMAPQLGRSDLADWLVRRRSSSGMHSLRRRMSRASRNTSYAAPDFAKVVVAAQAAAAAAAEASAGSPTTGGAPELASPLPSPMSRVSIGGHTYVGGPAPGAAPAPSPLGPHAGGRHDAWGTPQPAASPVPSAVPMPAAVPRLPLGHYTPPQTPNQTPRQAAELDSIQLAVNTPRVGEEAPRGAGGSTARTERVQAPRATGPDGRAATAPTGATRDRGGAGREPSPSRRQASNPRQPLRHPSVSFDEKQAEEWLEASRERVKNWMMDDNAPAAANPGSSSGSADYKVLGRGDSGREGGAAVGNGHVHYGRQQQPARGPQPLLKASSARSGDMQVQQPQRQHSLRRGSTVEDDPAAAAAAGGGQRAPPPPLLLVEPSVAMGVAGVGSGQQQQPKYDGDGGDEDGDEDVDDDETERVFDDEDDGGPRENDDMNGNRGSYEGGGRGRGAGGRGGAMGVSDDEKASDLADDAITPGIGTSDFKRGQRFKKLYRMIGSAQANRRMNSFKLQVLATVAFVLLVEVGCFVVMVTLLETQKSNVSGLNTAGLAARHAGEIAVYVQGLHMLYNNDSYPWLRHLTGPSDIPFMHAWIAESIDHLVKLHRQVYVELGGSKITDKFGLHALWNTPSVNISMWYDTVQNQTKDPYQVPDVAIQKYETRSLWDLGNLIAAQALDLNNNAEFILRMENESLAHMAQYRILMDNAGKTFAIAYWKHMDSMVQVVVDAADAVNYVQLLILILEGCVLAAAAFVYVWVLSSFIAKHRHYMYSVFVALPQPLVRTLATKRLNLDDDSDEEDDAADPMVKQALDQQEGMLTEKQLAAATDRNNTGKVLTFDITVPRGGENVEPSGGSLVTRLRSTLSFLKPKKVQPAPAPTSPFAAIRNLSFKLNAAASAAVAGAVAGVGASSSGAPPAAAPSNAPKPWGSKRRLRKSVMSSVQFTGLFVLWGGFIILVNGLGQTMLGGISSPIATFNLVNFLMLRVFRTVNYMADIAYATSYEETIEARRQIGAGGVEKEYRAVLYGGSSLPNETSPHFTLAKTGIAQAGSEGFRILYEYKDCMCGDPTDCHLPGDYYYDITHNGLDRMIQELIRVRAKVANMTGLDPRVYGPEFAWIWNVHKDLNGGLEMLNHAYHQHVVSVYQSVEDLHIAGFAVTCAALIGFLLFVLRPFLTNTSNESRRIAELLSQLPAEVDVETLVQRALLRGMGVSTVAPVQAPPDNHAGHRSSHHNSGGHGTGSLHHGHSKEHYNGHHSGHHHGPRSPNRFGSADMGSN